MLLHNGILAQRFLLATRSALTSASRHQLSRLVSGGSQAGVPKSPVVQQLWQSRHARAQEEAKIDASRDSPQLEKTPSDSAISVNYSFCNDSHLRRIYESAHGAVRVGRILSDLDALGGSIAFEHCFRPGSTPCHIVTSSVDHIVMAHQRADLEHDLQLSGHLSWAGQSLMDISMEATFSGRTSPWMKASFTYVALHSTTGKMAKINGLVPQTEEEAARFKQGSMRAMLVKQLRERAKREGHRSVRRKGVGHGTTQWANTPMDLAQAASQREIDTEAMASALLHQGVVHSRLPFQGPRNAVLLSATKQEKMVMCHPEDCNPAGRIFGGFLLERAYEAAFNTAFFFSGLQPRATAVGRGLLPWRSVAR